MKRLLLTALLGSFLGLIGVQAFHSHAAPAPDTCSVCALGDQAQRHAPAAPPRVDARAESAPVAQASPALPSAAAAVSLRSRGPPALS